MNNQIIALFSKDELELIQLCLAKELVCEKNKLNEFREKIDLIKDLIWYVELRMKSKEHL